ncbi:MAG: exodeoxyribonuclease V subunit gamma [Planctomycetes bacterium]|nr:exodeoxyribonuclease V subunit gamma [Planctomycetota bacterium]
MRDTVLHLLPTRLRVTDLLDAAGAASVGGTGSAPDAAGVTAGLPTAPTSAVLLGYRCVTFPELIEAIYRECPVQRPLAGPTTRRLLAAEILRRYLAGTRRYFASQLPFRGFVDELLDFFDDIRRARITPAHFRATLAAATALPAARRTVAGDPRRYHELADLLARYEERLDQLGLIDAPGRELAVLARLADPEPESADGGAADPDRIRDSAPDAAPATPGATPHPDAHPVIGFLAGVNELVVEDLYDLTPVQFAILLRLAARVERTRIEFPYNPERQDAYRFVGEHTLAWFEALGAADIAERIDPVFRYAAGRRGTALGHVLDHLFRGAGEHPPAAPADATLQVIAAPGPAREVEEIAREVRRRLEAGTRPETIGVLFRNLGEYGRLIEEVFDRARIPWTFRRGAPALAAPAVRTLLALLDTATHGTRRLEPSRIAALFGSAYLDLEVPSPLGELAAADVDEVLAAAGVLPGPWERWQETLARHARRAATAHPRGPGARPAQSSDAEPLRIEAVTRAVEDLVRRLGELAQPRPAGAHAAAVAAACRELGIAARARAGADPRRVHRDLAALAALDGLLSEIAEAQRLGAAPERAVELRDFLELLETALAETPVAGETPPGGGVRVLNTYDARGLAFEVVFVGGLVEGEFPLARREPVLFRDEERALFHDRHGRRLFRSTRLLSWEEPLLFCLALASARRAAVLSYPTVDARGRAVLPSYFVEEVLRLVGGLDAMGGSDLPSLRPSPAAAGEGDGAGADLHSRAAAGVGDGAGAEAIGDAAGAAAVLRVYPLSEVVAPAEQALDRRGLLEALFHDLRRRPAHTVDAGLAAGLRATLDGPHAGGAPTGPSPIASLADCRERARIELARERFFATPPGRRRTRRATPYTGNLEGRGFGPGLRRKLLSGADAVWSATLLEVYGNCPFAFFMDQVLELAPFRRPEVEMEATEVGTLAHKVLETFFRERRTAGALPLGDEGAARQALDAAAERVFADWEARRFTGDPVFWRMRRREVRAVLGAALDVELDRQAAEPKVVPVEFELGFGFADGAGERPFLLRTPQVGAVRLRGKIDRIDVGDGLLRVVDYKYSRSPDKFKDATAADRLGRLAFQLPLYLRAAAELLRQQPDGASKPRLEGAIFLLRGPGFSTRAFAPEFVGVAAGGAEEQRPTEGAAADADSAEGPILPSVRRLATGVGALVKRAVTGRFDVSPDACPIWCDFRHACRHYEPGRGGSEE